MLRKCSKRASIASVHQTFRLCDQNMPKYLIFLLVLSNFRECPGTVLRGSRAQEGQFPWLIQFHTIAPCGGVLLSSDWVLTAAQCVQYKRNSIVLYATGLNGTGTSQTVGVKATYMYPKFQAYSKSRDYDHNIALLKFVRAFDICDGKVRLLDIAPVRLDDDYKSCLIFGWESTVAPSSKVHAKPVQYSQVLLNAWRFCEYMHEGLGANVRNVSYRNVFCTMIEDEHGIRACAGNPGSPVVCEDQYQRMVLLGIASWSNFSLDCGGLPTYLGVSVFRSWMYDLIFGNKNMEQWEIGTETGGGACQRERYLGGIYAESNLQIEIHNRSDRLVHPGRGNIADDDEQQGDAYAMSWKPLGGNNNAATSSKKEGAEVAKIPELRGKLEPPLRDDIDDYTRVLAVGGPRKASNFDVVREREEQLSPYREIGHGDYNHREEKLDDPIAYPSEQKRVPYVSGKSAKKFLERETDEDLADSFDDLELVMPDGIDDFSRSKATTIFFHSAYIGILLTIPVYVNGNTKIF